MLDVGSNEINDMTGIEGLSELEELWVGIGLMFRPVLASLRED